MKMPRIMVMFSFFILFSTTVNIGYAQEEGLIYLDEPGDIWVRVKGEFTLIDMVVSEEAGWRQHALKLKSGEIIFIYGEPLVELIDKEGSEVQVKGVLRLRKMYEGKPRRNVEMREIESIE